MRAVWFMLFCSWSKMQVLPKNSSCSFSKASVENRSKSRSISLSHRAREKAYTSSGPYSRRV